MLSFARCFFASVKRSSEPPKHFWSGTMLAGCSADGISHNWLERSLKHWSWPFFDVGRGFVCGPLPAVLLLRGEPGDAGRNLKAFQNDWWRTKPCAYVASRQPHARETCRVLAAGCDVGGGASSATTSMPRR